MNVAFREHKKLPPWFMQDLPDDTALRIKALLSEFNLKTVCQEAKCPNLNRCFKDFNLTFMLLGGACTRNCRFCNVALSDRGMPSLDEDEPARISKVVELLGLNYVVVTSVTRDDLADGGSAQFSRTVELIHKLNRNIKVEILIPDFQGEPSSLKKVIASSPDVLAHNIETTKGLSKYLRPQSDYRVSLGILRKAKDLKPGLLTKSSIMLGMGEDEKEVVATMNDLKGAGCDILTLGQYLAPSSRHYPVKEFIGIERFRRYRDIGVSLGFKAVLSSPLARSSYYAEKIYKEAAYA